MAGVPSYIDDTQLANYIQGVSSDGVNMSISKMITTTTNGIEALPYQFMKTVDRRTTGTDVGRKYAERIFSRLPLLFITPCEPLFMDDFSKKDRKTVAEALVGGSASGINELISGSGRYYSCDFNYAEYYRYLNTMLTCLAVYLNLYDETIIVNGKEQKIGSFDWSNELNPTFKTFFSTKENLIFYLDGMSSVNESFSNETSESALASTINGFSDTAKEIRFLFGSSGNVAANLINSGEEVVSNITSSLSSVASSVAGGIVGSLTDKGVNTVLNGGKIIFPETWSNSSFDRSYSLEFKLRSPDHDTLSIFLNVLKPYCKLLALVLPRQMNDTNGKLDPNAYGSPFMVKAYSKGLFNIDLGIISSMSVTKGAECCWNDDGLPTQIDISIEIKDLYSNMAMSSMWNENYKFGTLNFVQNKVAIMNVCCNTAYMDFLANMAGLNIGQMEMGRRVKMFYYLARTAARTYGSTLFTQIDQGVSKLIGKMYNIL